MSRAQARASRALIAILALCLVVGLVFWFHARNKSNAVKPPPAIATTAPLTPADTGAPPVAQPQLPAPVVTQTPVGAPPALAQGNAPTPPATPTKTPPAPTPPTPVRPAGAPPIAPGWPTAQDAPAPTGHPMADAKAALAAGEALRARSILNTAMVNGALAESEIAPAKSMIGEINQDLVFSPVRHPDDPFVTLYTVASGDTLSKIAFRHDVTWELLARMNGITDPRKIRLGQKLKIVQGPFSAVVNKSAFTIDLWLGPPEGKSSLFIGEFPVGLGKEGSTPTGTWMVRNGGKLKNPKFWGAGDLPPIEADDPKNPLGEYWIALDGTDGNAVGQQSYGIHGTIDPDSIGKMSSLGCIRMRNGDIDLVYEMLVDGNSTILVRP